MNKSIDRIIHSDEYKRKVKQITFNILNQTYDDPNEATIASDFEKNLTNYVNTISYIHIDKEMDKNNIKIYSFKGRMDAIVSNLVIEYKSHSKFKTPKDFNKAINQLSNYLNQLKDNGVVYEGLITDGQYYISEYYINNKLHHSSIARIDEYEIDYIIKRMLNFHKKQLISRNIIKDFNKKDSILIKLQKNLYNSIIKSNNKKVKMLFEEWMDLFHLSLNDDGKSDTITERKEALSKALNIIIKNSNQEYKALFSMQTAYAIVVKTFALKIIPKIYGKDSIKYFEGLRNLSPNDLKNIYRSVESGIIFKYSHISNLIDEDFFSWYLEDDIWSDNISHNIQDLLILVNSYSDASLSYQLESLDLFKDLYMIAIPSSVRKAFGEIFTPDWLADQVVSKSVKIINKNNWTLLDPTAGSGTFLTKAISKVIAEGFDNKKSKDEILKNILNRVKGIDLSPLSVLTAKVSYLLSIRPFMNNILKNNKSIEIPVYLGDSARMPEIKTIDNNKYVSYSISTKIEDINITLPFKTINSKDFLSKINGWQILVNNNELTVLERKIKECFPENQLKNFDDEIHKFSQTLINLHKNKWDGIWLKIIANFLLPTRIQNVDIIAGNPPWVKWENLPNRYANSIKHIASKRQLFSGLRKGLGGGINLNLAGLISNVVSDKWLKSNGILAFIMPDTLLNSDSYEGWRKLRTLNSHMHIVHIDDWTKAGNPFKPIEEKFLTYYISKKSKKPTLQRYIKMFPKYFNINMNQINQYKNWNSVCKYYKSEQGILANLSDSSNRYSKIYGLNKIDLNNLKLLYGKNDYKPRQGVELTPREVYVFTKEKDGTYSNVNTKSTKIKPFHDNWYLDDSILRPLLQSKNIKPYNLSLNKSNTYYGIFPYYNNMKIIPLSDLMDNYHNTFEYLGKQQHFIERQSNRSKAMATGNEFYSLSKVGRYTNFDYAVAFRDNTKMIASFIDNKDKNILPVKHAPFISMDVKGNYISKNEAKYLTGILNTPIINKYFKITYSERSYSINFDIRLVKYHNYNFQKRIVSLVNKILLSKNNNIRYKYNKKIEQIYLNYLKNNQ